MEKISGIYSIIHIESGRPYVGSALDIYKRWSEHKSELIYNNHDNQRLQNFWNKYGEGAFEFRVLELVSDTASLLNREQYWMDKLESYNRDKGFNIRKRAESNFGLKHTSETIEKIRQGSIGKNKDKIGDKNSFFGKFHSDETKQRMRKPKSEEAKKNISISAKKRWEGHSCTRICSNCDTNFDTLISVGNEFCSKKCSSQHFGKLKTQNSTVEKTCLLCPNTFRTPISENKKYCSRKCWAISMKGNKNQIKKVPDK